MDQVTVSRELLRQVLEALTHWHPLGCKDGMTDSGGAYPWGEPVLIPCPICKAETALRAALEQPAVEPAPLTTEEYTDLAHRTASKYAHRSDPRHIAYTFLPHTLEQFTRAIEQAVHRKAVVAKAEGKA